eukprot:12534179-Ditylum_brightwellii.AAC.1
MPEWIKDNGPAAFYLPNMPSPKHGTLHLDTNTNTWSFQIGCSQKAKSVPLPNLQEKSYTLVQNRHLYEGHKPFNKIVTAQRVNILQETVAQHISTASL